MEIDTNKFTSRKRGERMPINEVVQFPCSSSIHSLAYSRMHSPTQSVNHLFALLQKAYPGELFFFIRVTELLQVSSPPFSRPFRMASM
jgi:hypothetical protein